MAADEFDGQTLPFTSHGWTRQIRSGTFRNGASWKQVEKVKVLGKGTMGAKLEEVHVLASIDVDVGGNKKKDLRKGQHTVSLKRGATELAFAINVNFAWAVLTYDCSCYLFVGTKEEAEEILSVTNWRRWANKGGEK